MLQLEGMFYRPVPDMPGIVRKSGARADRVIGELVADEISRTLEATQTEQIDFCYCISTMMDMPFVSGYLSWPRIAETIEANAPSGRCNFTASYECAGWGFVLDYARRRFPKGGKGLLVVVDLNVLDISFWRQNDHWGKSGFGISTVLVDLPPAEALNLSVNVAKSDQGMGEFCVDLRKWLKTSRSKLANVPFLPADMAGIYSHFLPQDRLMRDLHAQWGHCFGSDTWISFIDAINHDVVTRGETYCATSASLRGYWALCDVLVGPHCKAEIRDPITFQTKERAA